jgi:pyrimidine-nucleoside phosphorylase/thymidine phosphorylase
MRTVDILRRKRDSAELARAEIAHLVTGFARGHIPDYQAAAFLMAVALNGMTEAETVALTEEMARSGTLLDLSDLPGVTVDKHSTGGVGDKTSLVVAPLAAAAGVVVPMISGRALGHSGGTLDKLESIPGFDVGLDLTRFRAVLRQAGLALIGQTTEIAPADRKLYALRDVTATVECVPLIVASILSKKIAEGTSALVLDVKVGSGAFMKDLTSARELATALVATFRGTGKQAVALLTNMDQPLGTHVGNALEVKEAVEVLRGGGASDLCELCLQLTAYMLVLGGVAATHAQARETASRLIASGAGLEKLIRVVELQGGDSRAIEDPARLPRASHQQPVRSDKDGYVAAIDTESLGRAAMSLGAGRDTVETSIDPAVGLVVEKKLGQAVGAGETLVTVHYNDRARFSAAQSLLASAFRIEPTPPSPPTLVYEVIER